jgi:hypothetical protein
MTDAQRAKLLPYAQYGWTIGDMFGALAEYPLEGRSLQQVLAAEIAAISQRCEGQILSGSKPPRHLGEIMMTRFVLSCDASDGTVIINGTMVTGNESVAIIEHVGMASSTDSIKRADELVATAIEQAYR